MRIALFIGLLFQFFLSCKSGEKKITSVATIPDTSDLKKQLPDFFPVTSYIRGQLHEIESDGVNPMKITTTKNHTDSSWLKMEALKNEVSDFLTPEIDSTNLTGMFAENKFFDQTVNSVTLTYDPKSTLPADFFLKHWDIYIDPETGEVKRIYILKELPGNKLQQLTWLSGKSCKIVHITDNINGKAVVEKEVIIKWGL